MTVQDRTSEFFAAVESIQSRGSGAMQAAQLMNRLDKQRLMSSSPATARRFENRTEFAQMASAIAREITATSAKLEKLTKLAKKKSLFDDRPVEINELTFVIKEDISKITGEIKQLDGYLKHNQQTLGNRQTQEHSSNIVVSLQSKLAHASTQFKDILEIRSSNLKAQQARRDQFAMGSSSAATIKSVDSPLYAPEKTDVVINMPLQQQQLAMPQSEAYLDSRTEAIEGIEKTIGELAGLFQQLTTMISAHDDLVRRIDYNVDEVNTNIESAQQQLMRYMTSISSNRWLMIRIFLMLIFFFLVFVMFFA